MKVDKYVCNSSYCGGSDGRCVHKQLERRCPICGSVLVEVATTGHIFCAASYGCDYEEEKQLRGEV